MRRIQGDTGLPLYNVLLPIGLPPQQLLVGRVSTDVQLHFINKSSKVHRIGDGTVSITDAVNGKFTYNWGVIDLAIADTYEYYVVVLIDGKPVHYTSKILEVIYKP